MSTARHRYAGAPGTGTVTDNMSSRVKAWVTINNPAVTIAILGSLNTSSVSDLAVGNFQHNYTSIFTGTGGARFCTNSASATTNGWCQLGQNQMYANAQGYYALYMNGATPAVFDPAMYYMSAFGDLA